MNPTTEVSFHVPVGKALTCRKEEKESIPIPIATPTPKSSGHFSRIERPWTGQKIRRAHRCVCLILLRVAGLTGLGLQTAGIVWILIAMGEEDYETCSYCGKTIMAGVAQCPYCKNYTDDQGSRGLQAKRPLPRWFVVGGVLALVAMALFIGLPSVLEWVRQLFTR
jgi:hypothetical protein